MMGRADRRVAALAAAVLALGVFTGAGGRPPTEGAVRAVTRNPPAFDSPGVGLPALLLVPALPVPGALLVLAAAVALCILR